MSAVASATGGALAVRDDDAYRRRLYRLADRRRRTLPPGPSSPGTVFLQLDGVGHDVLLGAVARGLMPTVAKLLGGDRPSHRLTPGAPTGPARPAPASSAILHGSNHDIPAFRWYEKDTGEVMVCNRPTSAAELQRRSIEFTGDGGLLTVDGASRGNLFSGGADEQALVLSIATRRRNRENRSRAGYFAYFSDPANAVRTAMSFVAEVGREIGQSTRARLTKQRPGSSAAASTPSSAPSRPSSSGTSSSRPSWATCSPAAPPSTPTSWPTTRSPTTPARAAATPPRSSNAWTAPSR